MQDENQPSEFRVIGAVNESQDTGYQQQTPEPEPAQEPVAEQQERTEPVVEQPVVEAPKEVDFETLVRERLGLDYTELQRRLSEPKVELDEFEKGLIEYRRKTGDVTPYLEAKTVDFDKLSEADIYKRTLRQTYPTLSDKAIEIKYKQDVAKLHIGADLDEFSEDEKDAIELERELFQKRVEDDRKKFKDAQATFRAPEYNPAAADEAAMQEMNQLKQSLLEHPATQSLLKTNKLSIPVGDKPEDAFNVSVNGAEVAEYINDSNKFWELFDSKDGSSPYDMQEMNTMFALAKNGFQKSLKAAIDHGRSLGREEVTGAIKNPSTITRDSSAPRDSGGDLYAELGKQFKAMGLF